MRTSILQTVTPELAVIVAGSDAAQVSRLTVAAERLTLLTRPSRMSRGPQRYHPLVRGFLEARLHAMEGEAAVATLHRKAADSAAGTDWRVAAHHYREAGDLDHVAAVVAAAIPQIMGSGQYAVAGGFVDQVPMGSGSAGLNLIRSRLDMQRGAYESAIALSGAVLGEVASGSQESDHALLNLTTMFMHAGDAARALEHLDRLRGTSTSEHLRLIADGMSLIIAASGTGNLDVLARRLLAMAERQRGTHRHYFGVAMLNLAVTAILQDDPTVAVEYAREAIEALEETSSRIEISSAVMTKATALMMLGRADEAEREFGHASGFGQAEAALERADLADSYGDPEAAWAILDGADGDHDLNLNDRIAVTLQLSRYHSRRGRHEEASARLDDVDPAATGVFLGQAVAVLATRAYVAVAAGRPDAVVKAQAAARAARSQGAERWRRVAELLRGSCASGHEFATVIGWVGAASPWNLTFVADLVGRRLDEFDESTCEVIAGAARTHPGRWRFVLREQLARSGSGEGLNAARLLEAIGDRSDIKRLRAYARRQRRLAGASSLGRGLARRVADKVFIEDQNRVAIHVADRQIPGSSVRRKVLALVCFLLTKPDLASTRDQVLDALWPDLDPLDAVNSLNQTVYFLRRILEEDYVDDHSPGYLHHDADLIWFDRDLVTSRSNECRRLIKGLPPLPGPDQVARLTEHYAGRFALDFEYEEWATPYRDWLHASYLEVVERALAGDMAGGHFGRGIRLARRVLDIDPGAEHVEVSLLRMYRASGAHAAAAEQYEHYAAVIRDQLGSDPPPLESL
jgi:DNA-binding SARP family transcriptional activator